MEMTLGFATILSIELESKVWSRVASCLSVSAYHIAEDYMYLRLDHISNIAATIDRSVPWK